MTALVVGIAALIALIVLAFFLGRVTESKKQAEADASTATKVAQDESKIDARIESMSVDDLRARLRAQSAEQRVSVGASDPDQR